MLPFNLPDCINGVEAYEYPSLAPAKPLYTKLADWVINWIIEPLDTGTVPKPYLAISEPFASATSFVVNDLKFNSAYPGTPS